MSRIISLSEQYRGLLTDYMHKIYPVFSDAFIAYDVNEAIGDNHYESNSLLVLNDDNQIVGCHLNFNTKAWIYGKEEMISWGHNTYLNEEYRKEIGLDFVLEIARMKNGFGHGLSKKNMKIQHKLKYSTFITGIYKFRILNYWAIEGVVKRTLKIRDNLNINFPKEIGLNKEMFAVCHNASELSIPNNGYWNKGYSDIDFIRDEDFLNKRFFKNPVHKYYIYTNRNKDCYFVVRPILFRGIRAIILVDFRYLPENTNVAKQIFKATEKLCSKVHAGVMVFTTSNITIKNIYEKRMLCKYYSDIVTTGKHFAKSSDTYAVVTAADSDGEFYM